LEWAEFNGQLYGTARAFVEEQLAAGKDVILDIDVQGAQQVKSKVAGATAIFVLPPSFAELERRLKARMLEPDDAIRRRLEIAKSEILFYRDYDYIIINDILDNSIRLLESIVCSGILPAEPHRGDHRFVRRFSLITIPDNIDSKYRFVILSALRARQIQGGSMPLLKEPRHKSTQIAQKEILQGLVKFRIPEKNGDLPAVVEEPEE
jgi:DNA-directed RNA polymerase omega subunit